MLVVFSSLSCLELKYLRLSLVGFQQKLMPGKYFAHDSIK